jgi:hypothetical protein
MARINFEVAREISLAEMGAGGDCRGSRRGMAWHGPREYIHVNTSEGTKLILSSLHSACIDHTSSFLSCAITVQHTRNRHHSVRSSWKCL